MSKKSDREAAAMLGETAKAKPRAAKPQPAIASGGDAAEPVGPTAAPTKAEAFGVVAAAELKYEEVDYLRLFQSPLNPRRQRHPETIPELARSIVEKGLLHPLLCRPMVNPLSAEQEALREIAIGSRRHEAIGHAISEGWLPRDYQVAIRTRPMSDDELVIIAGVENFDREDMDALDEAQLFAAIRERVVPLPGQTREAATGALFHITERTVFRRLALLKLAAPAKDALRENKLTLGQAQALSLGSEERQLELLAEANDEDADRDYILSPDNIREEMTAQLIALDDNCGFDPTLYHGEIVEEEETGRKFFKDTAEVERLRAAAVEAYAELVRQGKTDTQPASGKWPWVDVAQPDSVTKNYQLHDVAKDHPKAGAVVWRDRWRGIVVQGPALRDADRETGDLERRIERDNPDKSGADPLSRSQQLTLHEAKTHTLRRVIAADDHLATALGVMGLIGAREVRIAHRAVNSSSPNVEATAEHKTRIAELINRAVKPALPKDKALLKTFDARWGFIGLKEEAQAALLRALVEFDGIKELHRLLIAERCGSWWRELAGKFDQAEQTSHPDGKLGDSPLAVEIASWDRDIKGRLDPRDWQPGEDYFKAATVGRLRALLTAAGLSEGARTRYSPHDLATMKKGDLVKACLSQPEGTWSPELFPETKFQTDAACAAALALEGEPDERPLLATKPVARRSDAECAAEALKVIAAYDKALRTGKATTPFKERLSAISIEMNGGTALGMHHDGGGAARLKFLTRADAGIEPLWGQPGHFEVAVSDDKFTARVDIKTDALFQLGMEFAFTAEAIEDGVFLTASGKRSFLNLSTPTVPKAGTSAWVMAEIARWRATDEHGKKRKSLRPLVELAVPIGFDTEVKLPIGEAAGEPQPEPAAAA